MSHSSARWRAIGAAFLLLLAPAITSAVSARAQSAPRTLRGTLGKATYVIEVPAGWNGTLLLFSHGTATPGSSNPASDANDSGVRDWLFGHGYALAGSSFSTTGWAVASALHDQTALLDYFERSVGHPKRVLSWGESQGALVAAGLAQRSPSRFAGVLSLCGPLAGTVGNGNVLRDMLFALKTLIAPDIPFEDVHFQIPVTDLVAAELALGDAQSTPGGRARIALVAALGDLPGWYDPHSPAPAADASGQEAAQFRWLRYDVLPYIFLIGSDLERKAGGNPTWNTGVDYSRQLAMSAGNAEVRNLYRKAGIRLQSDLNELAAAPRISPDPRALTYAEHAIVFDGKLSSPTLTLHTTGDGLVPIENEQAYAADVGRAGRQSLLRQLYIGRAGHCTFTPAETITAFRTLARRVNTGAWPAVLQPAGLDSAAARLGKKLNTGQAQFVSDSPPVFLRPFIAGSRSR